MVNSVNSGGYQAYSYQQATQPAAQDIRGGDNRIQQRPAPAGDNQRSDQRSTASRDTTTASSSKSNDNSRGQNLDVVV